MASEQNLNATVLRWVLNSKITGRKLAHGCLLCRILPNTDYRYVHLILSSLVCDFWWIARYEVSRILRVKGKTRKNKGTCFLSLFEVVYFRIDRSFH